MPIATKRKWVQ